MTPFWSSTRGTSVILAGCLAAVLAAVSPSSAVAREAAGEDTISVREGSIPIPQEPAVSGAAADHAGAHQPNRELHDLSIEELMEIEVETVFSASRYRQKVTDAPSSVTIITADEIRKFGYRTLADILRSVRGFATTYDRNYHYVGMRGFGRLGDFNTRFLLLVDGHRVNDAVFSSAAIGAEFLLDVDLIDRVEISRGPGSSLYGSNAFFGVVNIVTRSAGDVGGTELSAEAGSFGAYKARMTHAAVGERGRSFLASASGFTSDGERLYFREFDPGYPLADMRADNGGYADGSDYDRARSGYASYENGGFRMSAAYLERTKGLPTGSYGADFNEPGNRTVDERGYIDLQHSGRTDEAAEYALRVYYDHYAYRGDYLYSGTLNRDRAAGSWYGAEARIMQTFLSRHRIVLGAEYENRMRQDQSNADQEPSSFQYLDDHRSSRAWAAYLQDEITVSPIFLIYAGVRFDHVSTFGGTANPRLSAVITPVENGTLKLLYGRAFRAPTVYELYYEAPPSLRSNPGLRPEEIETYELVYEHALGKGLRAMAGRYSYQIRDLIVQTYDDFGNASYQNQEKAEATGTEFEVRKTWDNGSDGRLSYVFQEAENPNTGRILTNAPKHLAKLNLVLPLIREQLWIGVEEQYTGNRLARSGRKTPGYAVTNLTFLARNRQRTLEASCSIYNLLDEQYADPVSGDLAPLDTVRQDGRIVRIKATYAF